MSDIIIAVLEFPNDPTHNRAAHQMFLAQQSGSYLNLYSVSSVLGKERRVYGPEKDHYVVILPPEHTANGFKVPSFIDCSKMYQVSISNNINLSNLTQRNLQPALRQRINERIADMKVKGKHTTYLISESNFKSWNPAL